MSAGRITIEEVKKMIPPVYFYPDEKIRKLFGGMEYLTPLDVLSLKIPPEQRVCLVLRDWAFDEKTLRRIAVDFAFDLMQRCEHKIPELITSQVIAKARLFLNGECGAAELHGVAESAGRIGLVHAFTGKASAVIGRAMISPDARYSAMQIMEVYIEHYQATCLIEIVKNHLQGEMP